MFTTYPLSHFHFNKMSDGVLYEGFRIMQASKNHFKAEFQSVLRTLESLCLIFYFILRHVRHHKM